MLMKIYGIAYLCLITFFYICGVVDREVNRIKSESDSAMRYKERILKANNILKKIFYVIEITFSLYNIFLMFVYPLNLGTESVICKNVIFISFLVMVVANKLRYLCDRNVITEGYLSDTLVFAVIISGLVNVGVFAVTYISSFTDICGTIYLDRSYVEEYAYSFEIEEIKELSFSDIKGRRIYVKTIPASIYYYNIENERGNLELRSIDGNKNHIEKDISDEYLNSPHIKVYNNVVEYYNILDEKERKITNYTYIICVSENSIYELVE